MAKSTGTLGAGVKVGYSTLPLASPAVYIVLAELEDLTPPKSEREDVEISNHDSGSMLKEFMPGWLGASDPTAKWIYNKTDAATLQGMANDGVSRGWRGLLPEGSSIPWRGYVKGLGIAAPLKDKMTSDVTIKVDDSVVGFTAGS